MSFINRVNSLLSAIYGPGHSAFDITPADGASLNDGNEDVVLRALYVGSGGDITGKVATGSGTPATMTFKNALPGTVLVVAFTEIHATGTTASNLIGLL